MAVSKPSLADAGNTACGEDIAHFKSHASGLNDGATDRDDTDIAISGIGKKLVASEPNPLPWLQIEVSFIDKRKIRLCLEHGYIF